MPHDKGRHLLMLLSNEYTFDGRVRREAGSLLAAGHRVTVVAWDRVGRAEPEETVDGVRVVRLRNDAVMRSLRFDFFRLPRWWRRAAAMALRLHASDPFDLIHTHDYDTLPAAVRVKRRTRVPLVYDAHEIWGYMVERDVPRFAARAAMRHEASLLRHVDHVITVSEPLADHFKSVTGTPISIVMNAKPAFSASYSPAKNPRFTALYIGTLNATRLILETIEAARRVPDIEVIIAGGGKPAYESQVRDACAATHNVRFLGRVPEAHVLPMTSEADVVLCLFAPTDRLTRIGMPNKVFEGISTGRPVLATAGTYLGEFVARHGMGLAVAPDVTGIRAGLAALAADPPRVEALGRRALALASSGFDWPAQERTLLAVHDAVGRGPDGPASSSMKYRRRGSAVD